MFLFLLDLVRRYFSKSAIITSYLIVLSILSPKSRVFAAETVIENLDGNRLTIERIEESADLLQITNHGILRAVVDAGTGRADINLGYNPNSYIEQVSGEMYSDITMNHLDQKFIYRSGNFEGDIKGGDIGNYTGQVLVDGEMSHSGELIGIDHVHLSKNSSLSLFNEGKGLRMFDVKSVTLDEGSVLTSGGRHTVSVNNIDGVRDGVGSFDISGQGVILGRDQSIGKDNALAEVEVNESYLFSLGGVGAESLNINSGFFLSLSQNIDVKDINMSGNSDFLYWSVTSYGDAPATISSNFHNNYEEGKDARIYFTSSNEKNKFVKLTGKLGDVDSAFNKIFIEGNITVDMSSANSVYSDEVILSYYKHDSTLLLGRSKVDSRVVLSRGSNHGNIQIVDDHDLISAIGTDDSAVRLVEVAAGKTIDVKNSIYANSIFNNKGSSFVMHRSRSGDLNELSTQSFENYGLVDFSKAQADLKIGAIDNFSDSTFHVGDKEVDVANINFNAGAKISVDVVDHENAGLIRGGIVNVAEGVLLNVNIVNAHDFYQIQKQNYKIIESSDKEGSDVAAIDSSDIFVNNQNSGGKLGLLTVSTSTIDNDLILQIAKDRSNQGLNDQQKEVDKIIDQIGADSDSELLDLQNYLNIVNNVDDEDRKKALDSVMPNSSHLMANSFVVSDSIIRSIETRISSQRMSNIINRGKDYLAIDSDGNEVDKVKGVVSAKTSLIYANDYSLSDVDLSNNMWIQILGSRSKQDSGLDSSSYKSSLSGLVLGFDKKVDSSLLLGSSIAIADSNVKSLNNLTNIDSKILQLSIYAEKQFKDSLYTSFTTSVAKSVNNSDRLIPVISKKASSEFDSYNYSIKGNVYKHIILENGFDIIPSIGVRYSKNSIDSYQESGTGSLDLKVKTDDLEILEGFVGVASGYRYNLNSLNLGFVKTDSLTLYPKIQISYGYDFMQNIQRSVSNFRGHDNGLVIKSPKLDPSTIKVDLGTKLFNADRVAFDIKYSQERRDNFVSHSGLLEVKIAF